MSLFAFVDGADLEGARFFGTSQVCTIKMQDGARARVVWVKETGALIALHHGRPESLDDGELYFDTFEKSVEWVEQNHASVLAWDVEWSQAARA